VSTSAPVLGFRAYAFQIRRSIRLNGIDAPEKRQPFVNRSRQHLASLVVSRNVRAECYKRDRYG